MIDFTNKDQVASLKSNMHTTFESPQGKEVMEFIEQIGSWYPNMMDSLDTNEVIARDANRRLIGTLKTVMNLSVDQLMQLGERNAV